MNNQNNQLMNLDFIDNEAKRYHQSKQIIKDNSALIKKAIEDNTKREVEEVQNAIDNLNKKMEQIMKTDFIKDKKEKIELSEKQMALSIDNAAKAFFKVSEIIKSKDNLSEEKKREYHKKLYNKIIDKFITKEEKEMFEKLMSGGQIVIMGNPYALGGGRGLNMPLLGSGF